MEYKPKAKREMKKNAQGKEYAFVSKEELAAFKKAGLGNTLTDLMNYEAKMRKGDSGKASSGPTKAQQAALDKKMMELQKQPMKKEAAAPKAAAKPAVKAAPKAEAAAPKAAPKRDMNKGASGAPLRALEGMLGIDYGSKAKTTAEDLKKMRKARNEKMGLAKGGAAKKAKK